MTTANENGTRREFLGKAASLASGAGVAHLLGRVTRMAHGAMYDETLRVGLGGRGGRGAGGGGRSGTRGYV